MNPFSKMFEVDYSLLKPDLTASFVKLMTIVQESSCAHTNSTTLPMRWFAENKTGWVIVSSRVEVYAYPKYGDVIRAETCPSAFKGIMGERNFALYDRDNNCMLKAITTWIYTDLLKKRPIRAGQEMIDGYGRTFPPYLEKDYKLPDGEAFEKIHSYDFHVLRRDIDSNLHVNNIKYIEWALEGVPRDVYFNNNVIEMKTSYKKECTEGNHISVDTFAKKDGTGEYLTFINRTEPDGSEVFLTEIYTKWN